MSMEGEGQESRKKGRKEGGDAVEVTEEKKECIEERSKEMNKEENGIKKMTSHFLYNDS